MIHTLCTRGLVQQSKCHLAQTVSVILSDDYEHIGFGPTDTTPASLTVRLFNLGIV